MRRVTVLAHDVVFFSLLSAILTWIAAMAAVTLLATIAMVGWLVMLGVN